MSETSTDPETKPEHFEGEQVLLLPGHFFFVESVELPQALDTREIADFAELRVEALAPFPIEQLYWGTLHSPNTNSILIYAAHKDRIKPYGTNKINHFAWVLPDFASLYGAHFPEATEITLLTESSVSLLYFDSGLEAPSYIASAPLEGSKLSSIVDDLRSDFEHAGSYARKLSLKITDIDISENKQPTFQLVEIGTNSGESYGHWKQLCPTEETLWLSDLRNSSFKAAERNSRRTSVILSKATTWVALIALLLVALELLLFAGNAWSTTQANKISKQQPVVAKIEDRQTLMNKLEQVAQNELRPVAILSALNSSRPNSVYFTSTETNGENRITVDGIASTIKDLNNYTRTLDNSGSFELIGSPKSNAKGGNVVFEIILDYNHPLESTIELSAMEVSPPLDESDSQEAKDTEAPRRALVKTTDPKEKEPEQ